MTLVSTLSVGSDDGHEELMTAAKAAVDSGIILAVIYLILFLFKWCCLISHVIISTARSCSSSFWMKMEPFFRFVSDVDINYLKVMVLFY